MFITLLQTILAWFVIVLFLRKVKSVNKSTLYVWLFVIIWTVIITMQIKTVDNAIDDLFGVNHLGWLLTYVGAVFAFYFLHEGLSLFLHSPASNDSKWVYYASLVTLLALIILFPMVSQEPKRAGEAIIYSFPIVIFRLIGFTYAAVITTSLARILAQYRLRHDALHIRVRWTTLTIAVVLGSLYFWLRAPYIVLVYLFPEITQTVYAGRFSLLFGILSWTRIAWIIFFLPIGLYKVMCKPYQLFLKYLTLAELEILKNEMISMLPLTVRLHLDGQSIWQRLRNLDLLQYQVFITVIEGKKHLESPINQETIPQQYLVRIELLSEALKSIPDTDDFDTVVSAYKTASRKYCADLKANGLEPFPKIKTDETLVEQTNVAIQGAYKLIENLSLDFSQFSIQQLIELLEKVKKRKVFMYAIPMPKSFQGAWLSDRDYPHEYIFYDYSLNPFQLFHIQLHECGHFFWGHKTKEVSHDDLTLLAQALKTQSVTVFIEKLLKYEPYVTPEKRQDEVEAEALAVVIRSQAIRFSDITLASANINETDRFLEDMGLL